MTRASAPGQNLRGAEVLLKVGVVRDNASCATEEGALERHEDLVAAHASRHSETLSYLARLQLAQERRPARWLPATAAPARRQPIAIAIAVVVVVKAVDGPLEVLKVEEEIIEHRHGKWLLCAVHTVCSCANNSNVHLMF